MHLVIQQSDALPPNTHLHQVPGPETSILISTQYIRLLIVKASAAPKRLTYNRVGDRESSFVRTGTTPLGDLRIDSGVFRCSYPADEQ